MDGKLPDVRESHKGAGAVENKGLTNEFNDTSEGISTRFEVYGDGAGGYVGHNAPNGNRRDGGQNDRLDSIDERRGTDLRADSEESTGAEQAVEQEVSDTTEDDTQFSLSSPVEQKRDLSRTIGRKWSIV